MTDERAIHFEQVTLRIPDGRLLLDRIQLAIPAGATTALIGRSGSGKTTLLRMVNRLIEPTEGRILIGGKPASDWDAILLRRATGYVIQETGLFPHFNVERNIGIVLEIEQKSRETIAWRVRRTLELVGLEYDTFAKRLPHQLSGGQRQRIGLARALAAEPTLLLMDEPFGALDPLSRAEMQEMLRGLLSRIKKTVLLVTHDLQEACYLAERIVLLEGGRIVADLPTEDFLHSEIPQVRAYIHAAWRGEWRVSRGEGG